MESNLWPALSYEFPCLCMVWQTQRYISGLDTAFFKFTLHIYIQLCYGDFSFLNSPFILVMVELNIYLQLTKELPGL